MGSSFAYPLLRDNLSSSFFHELWLRYLIKAQNTEDSDKLLTRALGLTFKTPICSEAGLDVSCISLSKLLASGLSCIEIGPVTPTAEENDEKIFSYSLFSKYRRNLGALWVKMKLTTNFDGPRGINIIPLYENAQSVPHLTDDDYIYTFQELYSYSDYFTINLCASSAFPIEYYQKPSRYSTLINKLLLVRDLEIGLIAAYEAGSDLIIEKPPRNLVIPIMVKIDADWPNIEEFVEFCIEKGIDGILIGDKNNDKEKSRKALETVYKASNGKILIISYGGIDSGKEVLERIKRGAGLVQVFDALLINGSEFTTQMKAEILEELGIQGFSNINTAKGSFYN